jgi:hypothetical protein
MTGFFSADFFTEFFDIGTTPAPEGGGWGYVGAIPKPADDDDDILLAWFTLMRQPYETE